MSDIVTSANRFVAREADTACWMDVRRSEPAWQSWPSFRQWIWSSSYSSGTTVNAQLLKERMINSLSRLLQASRPPLNEFRDVVGYTFPAADKVWAPQPASTLIWVWGGGGWFAGGRLLTCSAFRMGAYSRPSRWALIPGWALIRINTVINVQFIRHIRI